MGGERTNACLKHEMRITLPPRPADDVVSALLCCPGEREREREDSEGRIDRLIDRRE